MFFACELWRRKRVSLMPLFWLLVLFLGQPTGRAVAAETIFLQDGRTIQADKVEIVGDTVRIEKPAETIEIPRSEVLSIHPSAPPRVSPGPADVYPDTTRQMNDKVRREIESRPGGSGVR
jgi:hypothetical protein